MVWKRQTDVRSLVVVENNTGRAIHVFGCGTLFQVALVSSTYRPAIAWPGCLQPFTIPVGESSYPVTVGARYSQCHQGRRKAPSGLPAQWAATPASSG
jgi:hypothetical protein